MSSVLKKYYSQVEDISRLYFELKMMASVKTGTRMPAHHTAGVRLGYLDLKMQRVIISLAQGMSE